MEDLRLHSPVRSESIVYQWPLASSLIDNDETEESVEILGTIRMACEVFPQLGFPLRDEILQQFDPKCYTSMKRLCDYYNATVDEALRLNGKLFCPNLNDKLLRKLLEHILQQVYNLTIKDPDKLNQYEPFSPEVYGETSFDLVCQMIDHTSLSDDDVFIDLGSGVGQVVLQMAALTPCKISLGIEKAEIRSEYAEDLSINFRRWMSWFGKTYGNYELIKGDFLDEKYREKIISSSIIFVNNYAFGPSVDHYLKQIFADLKDGVRIVSSKSFCPLNFRITDRNLSDIGTIMHVSEMQPFSESVSWTGKRVSYFLHVIDRTKLERYFQKMKQPKSKKVIIKGRESRDGSEESIEYKNNSTQSSTCSYDEKKFEDMDKPKPKRLAALSIWSSDEDSSDSFGAPHVTTRRAWSEYIKNKYHNSNFESFNGNNTKYKDHSLTKVTPTKRKIPKKEPTMPGKTIRLPPRKAKRKPVVNGLSPKRLRTRNNLDNINMSTSHEKVESNSFIIKSERPVPPALQSLLEVYKNQFLDMMDEMNTSNYQNHLRELIEKETEKQSKLKCKKLHLENQIKSVLSQSTVLLQDRMKEVGVNTVSTSALLEQAKIVVLKHKDLQTKAVKLEQTIELLEEEKRRLLRLRQAEIIDAGIERALSTPVTVSMPTLHEIFNNFPQR